jgi:hypothetical protein
MNSDRFKKIMFVVLFLAFAGIWFHNLALFLPATDDSLFRQVPRGEVKHIESKHKSAGNLTWGYKINGELTNPFQPFFNKINKTDKPAAPIIPELIIKPPFRYIGVLRGTKSCCAILQGRGDRTFVVAQGDTLESVKVLEIKDTYLRLRYHDTIVKLKLDE